MKLDHTCVCPIHCSSLEDPSCREEEMKEPLRSYTQVSSGCRGREGVEPMRMLCWLKHSSLPPLSPLPSLPPSLPPSPPFPPSLPLSLPSSLPSLPPSQSILDSTYHEESQLVREEFPPNSAQNRIRAIIGRHIETSYGGQSSLLY